MPMARERIFKPVYKLRKLLKKARLRPTVKQIHSLRTNARRFESSVTALGLKSSKNEKQLLRDLNRVRKRTGKIRDMDIITGYVLTTNMRGEQDCLVQLVEHIGAKRTKQAKKLSALVSTAGPRLRRRLKRTASKFQKILKRPESPSHAVEKALRLALELNRPSTLGRSTLHPYRLRVKQLQYVLQLSEDSRQQAFVAALKKVKDAIGEWHDWEVLTKVADDVLDHSSKCKLISRLHSISDRRYARSISLANQMRRTFAVAKSLRKNRRRARSLHLVKPLVLSAASALSA